MWTFGVDGGRVVSSTLAYELVEAVTQVLYLACSQRTTRPYQLVLMWVEVTTPSTGVGVTSGSEQSSLRSRPCQAP